MKLADLQHIVVVLVAFLATLGCYTAIALVGVGGAENVLRDVLLALGGVLGGVAIPTVAAGK